MNKLTMTQLSEFIWKGELTIDGDSVPSIQATALEVRHYASEVFGCDNYIIERIYLEEK